MEDKRLRLKFPKGTKPEDVRKMVEALGVLSPDTPVEISDVRMNFDIPGEEPSTWLSDEGYMLRCDVNKWYVTKDGEPLHEGFLENRLHAERIAGAHYMGENRDQGRD